MNGVSFCFYFEVLTVHLRSSPLFIPWRMGMGMGLGTEFGWRTSDTLLWSSSFKWFLFIFTFSYSHKKRRDLWKISLASGYSMHYAGFITPDGLARSKCGARATHWTGRLSSRRWLVDNICTTDIPNHNKKIIIHHQLDPFLFV